MKKDQNQSVFKITIAAIIFVAAIVIGIGISASTHNILPVILKTKNHVKPQRTCGTFAEDFTKNASRGELIINDYTSFTFVYTKATREGHAYTACWFPLENLNIDFSSYDELEIDLTTSKARRIPLNLSVQNNVETHQYVRQFIEIEEGKTTYSLPLNEFYTPSEWYDANDVTQAQIPEQDFSKVEAMSFESCHLLGREIKDQFTVNTLVLKKDLTLFYVFVLIGAGLAITVAWLLILKPFQKEEEIVHVPIKEVEYKAESIGDKVIAYLAKNYTNPDLTLEDLKTEFGKGKAEISNLIKESTKLTFPRYLNFLRIEEAKRILKSGDFKTVAEVGFLVGFNSSSNFIRVFKAQEGVSPKKFLEE